MLLRNPFGSLTPQALIPFACSDEFRPQLGMDGALGATTEDRRPSEGGPGGGWCGTWILDDLAGFQRIEQADGFSLSIPRSFSHFNSRDTILPCGRFSGLANQLSSLLHRSRLGSRCLGRFGFERSAVSKALCQVMYNSVDEQPSLHMKRTSNSNAGCS